MAHLIQEIFILKLYSCVTYCEVYTFVCFHSEVSTAADILRVWAVEEINNNSVNALFMFWSNLLTYLLTTVQQAAMI